MRHPWIAVLALALVGAVGVCPLLAAEDPWNGGFEQWETLKAAPPGWDLQGGLFPTGWVAEGRPGEQGAVRRLSTFRAETGSRGQYSLYLRGRVLSSSAMVVPRRTQVRITLWAKGQGGSFTARARFYNEQALTSFCNLATFLEERTTGEWQGYSAVFGTLDGTFMKLDLDADGVLVDGLTVTALGSVQTPPPVFPVPVIGPGVAVDGKWSAAEWEQALYLHNPFVEFGSGSAVGRQADVYLACDGRRLLVCVRAPQRSWPNSVRERDGAVWTDESVELYLNPRPNPQGKLERLYQFISNPAGTIFDMREEVGKFDKGWNCPGLEVGSQVEGRYWTLELGLPLEAVELVPGKPFGLNLCRNLQWPLQYTDLSGKAYRDLAAYAQCVISPEAPAVGWGYDGEPAQGRVKLWARVKNPTTTAQSWDADLRLAAEAAQARTGKLSLAPGAETEWSLPPGEQPVRAGEASFVLQGADGAPRFRYGVRLSTADLAQEVAVVDPPRDTRLVYYPLQEKIVARLNNHYGIDPTEFAALHRRAEFAAYREGREVLRAAAGPATPAHGALEFAAPLKLPAVGSYVVRAWVYDAEGVCRELISDTVEKRPPAAWVGNPLGQERKVLAPFTPLQVKGNAVSCWGRTYTFGASGLPVEIRSQGEQALAGPITLVREDASGTSASSPAGKLSFSETAPDRVSFSGESRWPGLTAKLSGRMAYDGLVRYRLELLPSGGGEVQRLSLEMPLRGLKYFHTSASGRVPHVYLMERPAGGWVDPNAPEWTPELGRVVPGDRAPGWYFPQRQGMIWSSAGIKQESIYGSWLPYLWAGNTRTGLTWIADSDRGWSHDETSTTQELLRQGDTVVMRVNFIAKPTVLTGPRVIEFALTATPDRPRVTGASQALQIGFCAGFGPSPQTDIMGATFQDPYVMKPYCLQQKGTGPARLYLDNIIIGLGDPEVRYYLPEWRNEPPREINASTDRFRLRMHSTDPWCYRAVFNSPYPSHTDYWVWWLSRWMDQLAMDGLYLDDSYPLASRNCQLPGDGYVREDGQWQGSFHLLEQREFLRRTAALCQARGTKGPHVVMHMTGAMMPGIFAFSDLNIDGENDHQRTGKGFMDYWVLPRMEIFGAGAMGGTPGWLELLGWGTAEERRKPSREAHGLVKLYDMWTWPGHYAADLEQKWNAVEQAFGIAAPDCRFVGYWTEESATMLPLPAGVKAGIYLRQGKGALAYVTNLTKQPQTVPLAFHLEKAGLGRYRLVDAESDQPLTDATVAIEGHDFRLVLVKPTA